MANDPSARLLRLLALLQTRREWPGGELAARLGVTDRTVRRDIDRVRQLGYPVAGTVGHAGGYQLAAGSRIPPLVLDEEEAVAITVALVTAAAGLAGMHDTALRALAKLEPMLPAHLRKRVTDMQQATVPVVQRGGPQVDADTLMVLAAACRDSQIVTFDYRSRNGTDTSRRVEPHSLVTIHSRWYLVGYDTDVDDWRTFRLDRLSEPITTSQRVPRREPPGGDAAAYVAHSLAAAPYRWTVHAIVHAPAEAILARGDVLPGRIGAIDEHSSTVNVSDDSLDHITRHLVDLDVEFTIDDGPPEIRDRLRRVAERLLRAARS
ncbi:MAG TPA: YafY family protein [Jiangellaceae bacterium]|nr:YafY family protein [Jiangellaceae bacterium]